MRSPRLRDGDADGLREAGGEPSSHVDPIGGCAPDRGWVQPFAAAGVVPAVSAGGGGQPTTRLRRESPNLPNVRSIIRYLDAKSRQQYIAPEIHYQPDQQRVSAN